ncbi:MAG: MarR family transcriptional regulator [Actinomycetota bacterium]
MEKSEIDASRLMQVLYRMARSRHALFQEMLPRYGVTLHQFHLLLHMRASGRIRVTELSDLMMVSKPTASRMAHTLCDKGMVSRKVDEADRRLVFLALTPRGEEVVAEIQDRQRERLARILKKVPAKEIRAFLNTVEKIEGELEAISKEEAGGDKRD